MPAARTRATCRFRTGPAPDTRAADGDRRAGGGRARVNRRRVLLGMLAAAGSPGWAREVGTVNLPDHVRLTADGPSLALLGAGVFRFLFIRYYVCGLYVEPGLKRAAAILAADSARRVGMVALRRISAFEFLFGLDRGLSNNLDDGEQKALAGDLDRLRASIRAIGVIGTGQRIAIDYVPGSGVRLAIDAADRATLGAGKMLADALLKVWTQGLDRRAAARRRTQGGVACGLAS